MRFAWRKVFYWLALFLVLSLLPFGLAFLGETPPSRPFWVEFGVGLGFVGMGLMALQFISTGRLRRIAPSFGSDFVLQFHRRAGIIGVLLVLAHPAVIIVAMPYYLGYLDPREDLLRALELGFVTLALILILVSSLWRVSLGLQYETWRLLHGLLALAIVFIGMVHGIQVAFYLDTFWQQALWSGLLLAAMYLVLHTRLVRPWLMRRRPWRVVKMEQRLSDTWTMTLAPEGHRGMRFEAGQFAWLTLGETPFSLQQHPFSFCSSARSAHVSFTAQIVGDFTATWADIEPGTRAFLEGPFGGFTRSEEAKGFFFIVGGCGIGPARSIIRTMLDEGDRRPVMVLYGSPRLEEVLFRDELEDVSEKMDLRVVHILEDPPADWQGESGLLDKDMLARYLPAAKNDWEYLSCGPEPLMNVAESGLRDLGVSWQRIVSERFEIV